MTMIDLPTIPGATVTLTVTYGTDTPTLPTDTAPDHRFCTQCGTSKPLSEFGYLRRGPGGRRPYCKPCTNAGFAATRSTRAGREANVRTATASRAKARKPLYVGAS